MVDDVVSVNLRHDRNGECLHQFVPIGGEIWIWDEPGLCSVVRHALVCQWCREVQHVILRTESKDGIEVRRGNGRERFQRSTL